MEKAVKTIVASLENPVNVDLGKCRELTRSDDNLYIVYIFYFVLFVRFLTDQYTYFECIWFIFLSIRSSPAPPHFIVELVLVLSSAGAETRTIVGLVLKH